MFLPVCGTTQSEGETSSKRRSAINWKAGFARGNSVHFAEFAIARRLTRTTRLQDAQIRRDVRMLTGDAKDSRETTALLYKHAKSIACPSSSISSGRYQDRDYFRFSSKASRCAGSRVASTPRAASIMRMWRCGPCGPCDLCGRPVSAQSIYISAWWVFFSSTNPVTAILSLGIDLLSGDAGAIRATSSGFLAREESTSRGTSRRLAFKMQHIVEREENRRERSIIVASSGRLPFFRSIIFTEIESNLLGAQSSLSLSPSDISRTGDQFSTSVTKCAAGFCAHTRTVECIGR